MSNDKDLSPKPYPDFHPDARAVAQSAGLRVGKAKHCFLFLLLCKTYPKLDKLDWRLLSASHGTVGSTPSTDLKVTEPATID